MNSAWQCNRERDIKEPFAGERGDFDLWWISRSTGRAERRQVVVLAVGFRSVETDDPEDLAEAQSRRRSFVVEIAARYGGTIGRVDPNLQIIAWGWPRASVADTRLAVAAALEIAADPDHEVRCGLDAGIAVTVEDDGGAAGLGFVGEMVTVAMQLQSQAAAGEVLASRSVGQLVAGAFELRPAGAIHDRERVSSVHPIVDRWFDRGMRVSYTDEFVGRRTERSLLGKFWKKAQSGSAQLVRIEGEAGVGKSALLRWLGQTVSEQAGIVVAVQCKPELMHKMLAPIRQLADRVARSCSPLLEGSDEATLIDIEGFDGDRSGHTLAEGSQTALNAREPLGKLGFDFLSELLRYKSAARPMVLLIEDIHWADVETARVLAGFRNLGGASIPLLVVVSAKLGTSQAADWPTIRLPRLGLNEIRHLIRSGPHAGLLNPETAESITIRSDGLPFHAIELAKLCVAHVDARGHYRLLARPNRLNSLLTGRLDELGELKPLARAAAVVGRLFDSAILAAALDVEERVVKDRLDDLVSMGLLSLRRGSRGARYKFNDALLWSQAYGSVVKIRRRQLHSKIAGLLDAERARRREIEPQLLAYHWKKAGQDGKAFGWWVKASLVAAENGAATRAVAYIREALAAKERVPDICSPYEEATLMSVLGAQLRVLRGSASSEAVAAYERATELVSRLPARPDNIDLDVASGLTSIHLVRGDMRAAAEASSRMLSEAMERGSEDMVLLALRAHGSARLHAGFVSEAIALFEAAVHRYDRTRRSVQDLRLSSNIVAATLAHLAVTQALAGNRAAFDRHRKQALALADQTRHPHTCANLLGVLAVGALHLGERGAAAALARASAVISSKHGYGYFQARNSIILSWAAALSNPADGLSGMRAAVVAYRATGARRTAVLGACLAADIALKAGKPCEALDFIVPAKGSAERMGQQIYLPEIQRLEASALLHRGAAELRSAQRLLDEAEALAREHGSQIFAARITTTRAEIRNLSRRGRSPARRYVVAT